MTALQQTHGHNPPGTTHASARSPAQQERTGSIQSSRHVTSHEEKQLQLTRMHRILIGVVVAGALVIAGIGFAGSYAA
ncbi:hypothetical protein, partial [Streptomyces sp. NPDC096934]|uniref:hypothetical protein n=1 Tax=Streptomyces sp. NPDC096934 TaxID=3155551 RepID=UPI003326371B